MKLFAFKSRDKIDRHTTNVCGAETKDDFKTWVDIATADAVDYDDWRMSTLIETMQNPEFKGLKYVRVFSHASTEHQNDFINRHNIEILNHAQCLERQDIMYNGREVDTWLTDDGFDGMSGEEVQAHNAELVDAALSDKKGTDVGDKKKITIGDLIGEKPKKQQEKEAKEAERKEGDDDISTRIAAVEDSSVGVLSTRNDGEETNIILKYKPIKIKQVTLEKTFAVCKQLGIGWSGNETDGAPIVSDWDGQLVNIAERLMKLTDGECCYHIADGDVRFGTPLRHASKLERIFKRIDIEETKLYKDDVEWDYQWKRDKKVEKGEEAIEGVVEIVKEDAQKEDDDGKVDVQMASEDEIKKAQEDANKLNDAFHTLRQKYGKKVKAQDLQDVLSKALAEADDNVDEFVSIATEVLDGRLTFHNDPDAPDNPEVYRINGENISELGLRMEYLPDDVAAFLKGRGHKGDYVDGWDYPPKSIVNGVISLPVNGFEVPYTSNARLCATTGWKGKTATMIFTKRDVNSPSYIVLYRPRDYDGEWFNTHNINDRDQLPRLSVIRIAFEA